MLSKHHLVILTILALGGTALTACDNDEPTEGTVTVEIWGEEFIEEGIPAAELADGWAITFDSFVVTVSAITAAGAHFPHARAVDLKRTGPHAVISGPATAGSIDPVGYSLTPASESTTNVNVDAPLIDTLVAEGWSVYVQGSATRDGTTLTFAWGFDVAVDYVNCHATGTVPADGTGTVQLTIHGDHLFYDSLVDHDASLRFDALAQADRNADGEITAAELAAFSGIDFGALDHYDVRAGSSIDNLWDFLAAQIETLGHIDGEGHCDF